MIYTNYKGNIEEFRTILKKNEIPGAESERILTIGYLDADINLDANGYSKLQFQPEDVVVLVRGFTLELTIFLLTCFGQLCPVYILFEKNGELINLSTPFYKLLSDGALWSILPPLIRLLERQLERDTTLALTISVYEELKMLDEKVRKLQTGEAVKVLDSFYGKA